MRRYLACECGFRVESGDLDDLVECARSHARRVHGMELSVERVAALAQPAPEEGAVECTDESSG